MKIESNNQQNPIEDSNVTAENSDLAKKEQVNKAIEKLLKIDPWEEIGFQRPLGSFWYSLVISLLTMAISLFFISIIYKYLYPYPEMQGYNTLAAGVFAIIYQIFDMGTAFGIERFIGEYRIKDPKKMLEYVRFFIWYQMFTGIIQVTALSIWIIQYFRFAPQFSYITWIFLIICQKQWPGMLGTFGAVLKGLQKFNKVNILNFVSGSVFQNITNIVFILLGRYFGQQNPAIGDLMGGAIGFAIGAYVDDFFSMALAGHYLNKELNILGYNLRDAVVPRVSWPVMKQCLIFGFQASLVPLLNTVSETIILFMFLRYLPQYATWIVLKSLAGSLTGIVNVGNFEVTSSIAESYGNNKIALAKFYVTYALKWNTFLKCLLLMIFIGIYPVLITVIGSLEGLENYQSAVIFIPFLLIEQLFFAFIEISDPILMGTLHIPFYTAVRLMEEIIRIAILYLLLVQLNLGMLGPLGVCLTLGWDRFYARLIKMVVALIYINRRVFKVEIYWASTIILPLLAALPVLAFTLFLSTYVAPILYSNIGILPTAALFLIFVTILPALLFFLPLAGFFGAFDDFQLDTFRKSVELAGPSKFLIKGFYKAVLWGHNKSPIKNKYKIPWEQPLKEIEDLLIEKAKHKLELNQED
jgi:hypothetical protein